MTDGPYKVQAAPDGGKNGYLTVETLETWLNENHQAGFEYVGMVHKTHRTGWLQEFCVFKKHEAKK